MLIDPFTIVAQGINFLILVVVLKYVLYDRIVAVIDQRQARIAEQLEEAERREAAASAERDGYEDLRRELEDGRAQMLEEAREAADEERWRRLAEVREDVGELRQHWLAGLDRERGRLLAELERQAAEEIVALGGQALRDLADARLEDQVVAVGLQRLADHRDELVAGVGPGARVVVRTAFPLDDDQRRRVVDHVEGLLGGDVEVSVERAPTLVCGLELHVGDHAFGWSVTSYLEELRRRLDEYLVEELEAAGASASSRRDGAGGELEEVVP